MSRPEWHEFKAEVHDNFSQIWWNIAVMRALMFIFALILCAVIWYMR